MRTLNNFKDEEFKNEEGTFFKTYIGKVEESLSKEQTNAFSALKSDEERIQFVYKLDLIHTLELPHFSFNKNGTKALEFKNIGNKFYGQSLFGKAATNYWLGLLECPSSEGIFLHII